MSRQNKQRNIEAVNLTDRSASFLDQQCNRLNMSPSAYINDVLIYMSQQQRELNQCPDSYIALCRDGDEVTEFQTHLLRKIK